MQVAKRKRYGVVRTNLDWPARKPLEFQLRLTELPNGEPQNIPGQSMMLIDGFAGPELPFQILPDGDRNVKSDQSVRLAAPLEGPPAEGVGVLAVSYRFEAGHKFVQVMPTKDELKLLPGRPQELRMWVLADRSGNIARCRVVDATGQVFQPSGTRLTWGTPPASAAATSPSSTPAEDGRAPTWQLVRFPLDGHESGHWGGKNDGVIHYPLKLDTLLLIDSATRQPSAGTVYVASPMTVE